jgi:outer membrane protein assembly factor BamA
MISLSLACVFVASAELPRHIVHTKGRMLFERSQVKPSQASLIREAEREGYVVRRTEFLGNARTADMVLRRRLMLNEGDLFTVEKLEQSIQRLSKLKVIKPVRLRDVDIRLDREYKVIDMAFRVREKRRVR